MNEAGDNPFREEPASLGATLGAERERQGLSRADIAHRLHMSPGQVEALETGDYAHLPRGTFLRGFVRNYAKALGIAADPLLEMLAGAVPAAPTPGIVVPTQNIRFDPLGERFSSPYVKAVVLALVAIAIGFAAMYWAMYVRPRPPALAMHAKPEPSVPANPPTPSTPSPAASDVASAGAPPAAQAVPPAPVTSAPSAPAKPAAGSADASAPSTAASKGAPKTAPATASPEGPKVASAAGAAAPKRLHFHFTGDSWVEVRDASGKILLQRLNAAGTEAQVSGRPPLQVIVGNAPEVEMTLDGKPYDLDPHTQVAVARFTLE